MKLFLVLISIFTMVVAGATLAAQNASQGTPPAPAAAKSPAAAVGLFVYPQNKQAPGQQAQDENECYASARQQSGIDPTAPPPAPQEAGKRAQGAAVKGAAGGAAGGAAVGAIAGDAGEGAAIGATLGAMKGRRAKKKAEKAAEQQAVATAQQQQARGLDTFKRAMSACLDARGYSVK